MDGTQTRCPHCRSPYRQIKWGRTPAGSQKYRCQDCLRVYTPHRKPYGYPEDVRQTAVQMYVEGANLRQIARALGVNHQSVSNWINSPARRFLPVAAGGG
jgi:transposase-like protein